MVPQELLEKHEHEIASIEARHRQDLDSEREKLAKAEAERKKAQETLEQNGKELEEIRERAKDTLARYEKNKEQITKEVKKEVEKELKDLKKERETREAAMKAKQDEIAGLNGEIETLNNRIYGYDSQVALWRHEIARVSETVRQKHRLLFESRPDRGPAPGDLRVRRGARPVLGMSQVGRRSRQGPWKSTTNPSANFSRGWSSR